MVGSRHLQGTIISRVKYLLQSGSLKKAPIWYDIVRRFPPPITSLLSTVGDVDRGLVQKIKYPEDAIKREFYKDHFRAARDPESLFDDVKTVETKTEIFLNGYYHLLDAGHSPEKALEGALVKFKEYLSTLQNEKYQSLSASDQESFADLAEMGDLQATDIYEIFSSSKAR